jgi:hypothetical protein
MTEQCSNCLGPGRVGHMGTFTVNTLVPNRSLDLAGLNVAMTCVRAAPASQRLRSAAFGTAKER